MPAVWGKLRTNAVLGPHVHPAPDMWLIFRATAFPYEHILSHSFPVMLGMAKNFAIRIKRTLKPVE